MKTNETLDLILYDKGTYASGLLVLILSAVSDVLVNLIERLFKKIDRLK